MKLKLLTLTFLALTLSGCGKLDVRAIPNIQIQDAKELCIIDDPATREGFECALASWAEENGMAYKILSAGTPPDTCEWSVKYRGKWRWDVAVFLADAKITAYHTGRPAAQVEFLAGQWDTHKYESGEQRVHKLMDMLSGKIKKYPTKTGYKKK